MEEPLPAGGSCLLGSINLSEFVENKQFNFNSFQNAVSIAVEALNEVLDEGLPLHPLQEQRDSVANWRQIGLGVMGIADMLIKMELPYDSDEAIQLCDEIGFKMADMAIFKSAYLADEYGSYPKYDSKNVNRSQFYRTNTEINTVEAVVSYGLRNSQLLTIAPTGTLSTMLGISGGIEPIYANSYTRKTESLHGKDVYYKVYTPIVEQYMKEHGLTDESQLPKWFVTSSTIDPMKRIAMQAAWQRHIDASISSTINLPNEATVEGIEELYMEAWKQGLKGLTIYRDGCKRSGILSTSNSQQNPESNSNLKRGEWKKIAPDTKYYKRKIRIGCGKLNLFIGWSDSEKCVQELWVKRTGQGGCEMNIQASVIAMSGMLRLGGNIFNIEKAFEGLGACNSFVSQRAKGKKLSKGTSCATAILNEIKAFLKEKEMDVNLSTETKKEENQQPKLDNLSSKCPECGEPLTFEGGCVICHSCGYSKCE